MSMRSWTVGGFGILASDVNEAPTSNKVAFIKQFLPGAYEKMEESGEDVKSWMAAYEGEFGLFGFAAIFADAINQNEEDFNVEYCDGEYPEESAILYEDRQPWDMSERVKNMKPDDMRELFNKYLVPLDITAEVSRRSVEYYG